MTYTEEADKKKLKASKADGNKLKLNKAIKKLTMALVLIRREVSPAVKCQVPQRLINNKRDLVDKI